MGIEHEHFSIRNSVINDNRELMPLAICSLQFAHIHFFRCQSNACHKSNCSLVSTVGTHTRAGCTINLIKCEKLKIFQFCFIVTSNSHWMFPGSNRDKDENSRALARIVCTWMDRARTSMIARMHTVRLPHFILLSTRRRVIHFIWILKQRIAHRSTLSDASTADSQMQCENLRTAVWYGTIEHLPLGIASRI